MPSKIRHGLLISVTVIGLFLTPFATSDAGSMNYIYDDLGRLYQVVDPQGNVTTYNYDSAGNRLSITRGTAQEIVSVNPRPGITNVALNTLIAVLFTKPVDRTTINGAIFSLVESNTGTPVQGTFSFDFDDRMVIFDPQSVLKPNLAYTLTITTDLRSSDGMPLHQSFSGSFVTGGATDTVSPTVTSVPVDGATGVPMNTNVVLIFSEPMDPTSLNASTIVVTNNGVPVSGNITLNGINTITTFDPSSNFLPNSPVNVTVSSRVTDRAGNPIVGSGGVGTNFIISFTTASSSDNAGPEVLSITPADGATGIDRNTIVSVTFNEAINPATVDSETFTISVGGVRQSGNISFSGQSTIITFTPDQILPTLSLVTITLLPGINDIAGNGLISTFTSSFTTQGEPRLSIEYPGPTTLTIGDQINVEVANIGDWETTSEYTVKLNDQNDITIYQNSISDSIPAGSSKTYSFQIPNQAGDSDYTLYAEVIDSGNIKTTNSFGIKIIGVNATLSARTDKDIYIPTDSITCISSIVNGPFGIEGGSLKVSVTKRGGEFTHFLPKEVAVSFSYPGGVAVGADGSVYVADTDNNRIQKFDGNGNFITKWGTTGSADGQFSEPWSVAVGPDGSIYVADSGNNRVQKFDSTGNLITKWGTGGSGDGQFEYPVGISVDSDGSVYVADVSNHRIQKFDSAGNFIAKWGTEGSEDGQFEYPVNISVGSDGSVYVADSNNHRIQKFNSSGVFIAKWGSYCETDTNGDGVAEQPCNGQFNYPEAVAVGQDGSVYVTDDNQRVQKFDSSGNFIAQWGSPCEVDSDWDGVPDQPCDGQFNYPYGIAVSPSGSVFVADSSNNRIEKFDSNGDFILKWGNQSTGSGDGEFNTPFGVTVGYDGSIYVSDSRNNRIQKFDSNGNFITKWGTLGNGDGQFDWPAGIASAADGSVYVADSYNNRIQKFDSNGNFIAKWVSFGVEQSFNAPLGIAAGSDGVYVADTYNYRIEKFGSNGNLIIQWGIPGGMCGEVNCPPTGIAVGPDGAVYVVDPYNHRIHKFDSNGNFITSWEFDGATCDEVCGPTGITVGPDSSVYVTDKINHSIQKFDGNGNLIAAWGSYGSDDGQFINPGGIAVALDSIYVADTGNNRIQRMTTFQKLFETTLPINQPASTTQEYTTNIGILDAMAELHLETTLMNSFGQAIAQANYPFYLSMDTMPPTGTITINSGAGSTNNPNVTLALSCSDDSGCAQMQFSNDNVAYSGPEPYAITRAWTLASGDGVKTVYVKFKDTQGNWSAGYSSTILLDTTLPTTTASPAGETYNSAQSVTLACNDGTGSGCDKIYYTTDGNDPTTSSLAYSSPVNIPVTTTLKFFAKDLAGNSETIKTETYTISTNLVTVELKDSTGGPLSGGVVQYYSGGWQTFGTTDASGRVSRELQPGTYTFGMNYAFARQEKSQNIASNPTVVFQTTNVTVQLKDSTGALMDTGTVQYYSGGWRDIGSTSGGQVSKQLLPGTYTFSMNYAFARQEKAQNIATNSTVVFQTINATVQLKDSTGALMDTGTVQYYSGGWHDIGSTSGGQVSKELLPGTYTFSMNYAFARQEKAQNIGTNPTVVFQTISATVQLKDSTGALMDTGTVQYYSGGWRDIGSTSGGQVIKELLPGSYTFSTNYAFARQEKAQNISTNPTVVFQTVNAMVQLKDSTGALMDTGTVQYYSGGWRDIGSTSGGHVTKELLPGTFTFSMNYGFARQEKAQNVAADPTVVFNTGRVHSDSGSCSQYYAGGWRTFTQDMELLPIAYTFRFNDGTSDSLYTVIIGTVNHIH